MRMAGGVKLFGVGFPILMPAPSHPPTRVRGGRPCVSFRDTLTMPDKHAVIDPITGFLDRRSCLHAAHRMLAAAESKALPLAALWIDLDRFRQINASFGHAAGDEVIARVAGRMRMVLPAGGHVLARMGSDEFVVMLSGEDRPVGQHRGCHAAAR